MSQQGNHEAATGNSSIPGDRDVAVQESSSSSVQDWAQRHANAEEVMDLLNNKIGETKLRLREKIKERKRNESQERDKSSVTEVREDDEREIDHLLSYINGPAVKPELEEERQSLSHQSKTTTLVPSDPSVQTNLDMHNENDLSHSIMKQMKVSETTEVMKQKDTETDNKMLMQPLTGVSSAMKDTRDPSASGKAMLDAGSSVPNSQAKETSIRATDPVPQLDSSSSESPGVSPESVRDSAISLRLKPTKFLEAFKPELENHYVETDSKNLLHIKSDPEKNDPIADQEIDPLKKADPEIHPTKSDPEIHAVKAGLDIHATKADPEIHPTKVDPENDPVKAEQEIHAIKGDPDIHATKAGSEIHPMKADPGVSPESVRDDSATKFGEDLQAQLAEERRSFSYQSKTTALPPSLCHQSKTTALLPSDPLVFFVKENIHRVTRNTSSDTIQFDLHGTLSFQTRVHLGALKKVQIEAEENLGILFEPAQEINKELFLNQHILSLEDLYPSSHVRPDYDLDILRWNMTSVDKSLLPLLVDCLQISTELHISYQASPMSNLRNVMITVPFPNRPVLINSTTGTSRYDDEESAVRWSIKLIEESNERSGTLEIHHPAQDALPDPSVYVEFSTETTLSKLKVVPMRSEDPRTFSQRSLLSTRSYVVSP